MHSSPPRPRPRPRPHRWRALRPGRLGDGTAIVSRVVEDYKNYASAELGRVKNLNLDAGLPGSHAYGLKAGGVDDWSAGDCIRGADDEQAQKPDKDLGTTLRPGAGTTFVTVAVDLLRLFAGTGMGRPRDATGGVRVTTLPWTYNGRVGGGIHRLAERGREW